MIKGKYRTVQNEENKMILKKRISILTLIMALAVSFGFTYGADARIHNVENATNSASIQFLECAAIYFNLAEEARSKGVRAQTIEALKVESNLLIEAAYIESLEEDRRDADTHIDTWLSIYSERWKAREHRRDYRSEIQDVLGGCELRLQQEGYIEDNES